MSIIRNETDMHCGKFIALRKLEYVDRRGIARSWESADRVNGSPRGGRQPSAVLIIARIVPDDEIILVRQFRPPAGKYIIEFPAGLIEPGETPESTAIRELYEETGYQGTVDKVIPPSYNSPGMSGETVSMVLMTVDKNAYPEIPENHQEDSEDIETIVVSRADLPAFVERSIARGDGIDARIAVFAAMS